MGKRLPKTSAKTKLSAQAMAVLAELIKRPWLTQNELAEIAHLSPRQIGTMTRAETFKLAMWEALEIPEDYLRKVTPQALQFLGRTIRDGMPRKDEHGATISPGDTEKDRAVKAATALTRLGISHKIVLEGGANPVKLQGSAAVFEWVAPTEGGPTAEDVGGKKRGNPRKPKPKEK